MRFGILGYGTIAHEHARALSEIGCELVAVAGPTLKSARAFAEAHRVGRVATDVSDVIEASDIDAIVVASPNAVHAEQVLLGLEHGKHVLCEVPLALSLSDAVSVAQASRDAGSHVMVCQTQRFLRPLELLRARASLSTIRHVVIRLVLNRTANVGISGRARTWTDDLVWHHGSHAVDSALWLLGANLADVTAFGTGDNGAGVPMDLGVVMRASSGSIATIALSYRAEAPSTDFMVICDDDTYRYECGVLSHRSGQIDRFDESVEFAEAVSRQDAAFVDAVAANERTSPTPAELVDLYNALHQVTDHVGRSSPRTDKVG